MGRLIYQERTIVDIEDRLLSHLRIVVMNKLRRQEPFMRSMPHPDHGQLSIWMHPSTPIVMQFYGSRPPSLDRDLIEEMMTDASGPDGLTITPGRRSSARD
ncbi:MAG: ATP-dependent DNA ligase [Microbacterium enclense]